VTKQLLIYQQIAPISKQNHVDLSVKLGNDYSFAKSINSAPLMAIEFPNAAADYAIVFAGADGEVIPVIVLGIEDNNLYVTEDGGWTDRYIPAFIRRYPFVFSSPSAEGKSTLCIDEEFSGCNREGIGERLFDSQGEQTQYLQNMLGFLQQYQAHFQRTQIFCKRLKEYNLLEPALARLTLPSGEQRSIGGFSRINRDRLKSLTDEQLLILAKTEELELIHLHLYSLRNFSTIAKREGNIEGLEETKEQSLKG
jgi:hypothetical protein